MLNNIVTLEPEQGTVQSVKEELETTFPMSIRIIGNQSCLLEAGAVRCAGRSVLIHVSKLSLSNVRRALLFKLRVVSSRAWSLV
jgi:hypothetical protein